MKRFENKRVIVTGAASGIGKAVAQQFLDQGAVVGLLDIDETELKAFVEATEGQSIYRVVDVSKGEELLQAVTALAQELGGVDILHVNAGDQWNLDPIEELSLDDWDTTITTNLRSTFVTVTKQQFLFKINGGSIVITSSVNGNRIFKNFGASACSTSKAGQVAFTKMAALPSFPATTSESMRFVQERFQTNIDENTAIEEAVEKSKSQSSFRNGNVPLRQETGIPEQVA